MAPTDAPVRGDERFCAGQSDADLLTNVVAYYAEALKANVATLSYLRTLRLADERVLDTLQLGLCDRTLGLHLPLKVVKAGSDVRAQLLRLGIVRSSGHEHLRGCITLPVLDADGRVVDVLGFALGRRNRDVYPTLSLTGSVPAEYAGRLLSSWVGEGATAVTHGPVVNVQSEEPTEAATLTKSVAIEIARSEPDAVVLDRVVQHYCATLDEHTEALRYLSEHGLGDPGVREHFRIGFSDHTLQARLPSRTSTAGKGLREQLARLEVLADGREVLHGDLTVPLLDARGAVVQVHGRPIKPGTALLPDDRLPGPARGVLNALGFGTEVIVADTLLDAFTFWAHGLRHVTVLDDGEVNEELVAALHAAGTERVLVIDGGLVDPGAFATHGLAVHAIRLPSDIDVNAYARQSQDAPRALGELVRGAEWVAGPRPAQRQAQRPVAPVPADQPERAPAAPEPEVERTDREVTFRFEDRRWRVRGLERNLGHNRLKVNLLVTRSHNGTEYVHIDTIELYVARQRATFTKQAATELGLDESVIKRDLGALLLRLEALQDDHIRSALEPRLREPEMTAAERDAALELLRDPHLLDRITSDFTRAGLVGETVNTQVGYLAATSRKLDEPLAVLIQSSTAAGKSTLMDAVLSFMPEEDRVAFSAMTGQSLYYLGQSDLKHRILAIAEEEGVQQASYALKMLQSAGELTIASTGKDAVTGRLTTQTYSVQGPVSIFMTTTAIDVDEELLNRCIVLTVDEGREQTRAIHAVQRRNQTLDGLVEAQQRAALLALHQNAQRLLEPLHVVNPFADRLRFADHQTRTRRDHVKYLSLIQVIALLHQHQRDIKETRVAGETVRYIEVTEADIEIANKLAHAVLGRSLDELPPQTRRLLTEMHALLTVQAAEKKVPRSDLRFQRRWLREQLGWGDTQLKVHLARLVDLELVLAHRSREERGLVYELLWDGQGQDGAPFVTGLIQPALEPETALQATGTHDYDVERSGSEHDRSGSGRPSVGPRSAGGQGRKRGATARSVKKK